MGELMTRSKEDESAKTQLLSVKEILKSYQELLESSKFSADYGISFRTFKYWVNRGLFDAPLRGKFNRALYPANIILDLLAIRTLQLEFYITLEQIKRVFPDLPFKYWDGLSGIKREKKENVKITKLLSYLTVSLLSYTGEV